MPSTSPPPTQLGGNPIPTGHAERILADLELARADVASLQSTVRGTVRLAAFPTAAGTLVPGAIARCRGAHPDLRVLLEERETRDSVQALRAGHIDLALIYDYALLPQVADTGTGIGVEQLLTEPLLLVLPSGMVDDDAVTLGWLRDQPWIGPHSDTALRDVLERACALAGFVPQLDYTSDDYTVIVALVAAGLGVALIPQLAVESLTADVALRPVAGHTLTRTVSLATRSGSAGHPIINAVADPLRRAAAEHVEVS